MLAAASIGFFALTLACYVTGYAGSHETLWELLLLFGPLVVAAPLGIALKLPRAFVLAAAMLIAGLAADALRAADLIQVPSSSYDELGGVFYFGWSAFLTALFVVLMIVSMLLRPSTWRRPAHDQTVTS